MEQRLNKDQCTGCGNCLTACPLDLLRLSAQHNRRGVCFVENVDPQRCIACRRCELMCTAGAIDFLENNQPVSNTLIDKQAIPPHAGCYLGSLTKALADAIDQLGVQEQVVIFKKKAADVNLNCELHDYADEQFYQDGLAYKRAHPEKLVILICSSSKAPSTALNQQRFNALRDESVTIINTLNWFERDEAGQLIGGGSRMLEQLRDLGYASYLARGSVRSPEAIGRLTQSLRKALRLQRQNRPFAVVEIVFPCFYRLAGRPQRWMSAQEIEPLRQWFASKIEPEYPEEILKEGKE